MSCLLRSLLFCGIVFGIADLICAQAPPLPAPPRPDREALASLGSIFSGSDVPPPQSVQPTEQDVRFPEYLPSPNRVRQATFESQPLSSPPISEKNSRDESSEYPDVPYESEKDEYVDAHYAVLGKTLGGKPTDLVNEGEKPDKTGWTNTLSMPNFEPIISVGSALFIVIAAFFILAIFLRKVSPPSSRVLPKEAFECLGRYYLTQKHQVQLLRMGNRIVLVSVMPDGVSTLAEITDPDEAVSLLGLCRRLDKNSATEMFRKTVASMSEEELSQPYQRPVVVNQRRGQSTASFDAYSDPDESIVAKLTRGKQYR